MMTAYRKKNKQKNNNIFCILNWGMAVSCSRNMNFVKYLVSEMSEENFSMFDNFCIFAHFCIGAFFADQVELTKHTPYILIFHVVSPPPAPPPLTQHYFFLTLPLKISTLPPLHTPINKCWFHRLCSFLNILLFKILPQSCYVKRLFLRQLITTV